MFEPFETNTSVYMDEKTVFIPMQISKINSRSFQVWS